MSGNIAQEQRGVAKVMAVSAELDAIWRPTSCHDLGIDGQIEFLEPGTPVSTGYLLGVQVKCGPSYFLTRDGNDITYWPQRKHRHYWERYQLPVILVLHQPDDDTTIFASVKPQLRREGPLRVPLGNVFGSTAREALLTVACSGPNAESPAEVLGRFARVECKVGPNTTINGTHFLLACTHPGLAYFELRMGRLLAVLDMLGSWDGCIGSDLYDYIGRCADLVLSASLTEPFAEEFDRSWFELQMVPDLAVGLTPQGSAVLRHLVRNAERYVDRSVFSLELLSATELPALIMTTAQEESDRLDKLERPGEASIL